MSYIFIAPMNDVVSSRDLRKARRFANSFKFSSFEKPRKGKLGKSPAPKNRIPADTGTPVHREMISNSWPEKDHNAADMAGSIELPLKFQTSKFPFDRESPLVKFFTFNCWNSDCLCRVPHITGYQAETAINQIASAPRDISAAIGQVLLTIEGINRISDPNLLRAKLGAWMSVTTAHAMNHGVNSCILKDDETLWDRDIYPGTGYQVISISHETQLRRHVAINNCFANMFGMHEEELLNRLANHDLCLPYIEMDSLSVFLFTLLQHPMPGRRVKYLRMYLGGRFMLVCWSTVVVADAAWRVTEVCTNYMHVTYALGFIPGSSLDWNTSTYMHACMHAYIHTYIHIYIYICMYVCPP
jgi:hypothetical protein